MFFAQVIQSFRWFSKAKSKKRHGKQRITSSTSSSVSTSLSISSSKKGSKTLNSKKSGGISPFEAAVMISGSEFQGEFRLVLDDQPIELTLLLLGRRVGRNEPLADSF
jgi:hypothetical protein